MKTELTNEQSQHLIKLGVPKEKASIKKIDEIRIVNNNEVYDWSYKFKLTDLLEILESMKDCDFTINHWKDGGQDVWTGGIDDCIHLYSYSDELIDVIYEQTVCAVKYGYLKFE